MTDDPPGAMKDVLKIAVILLGVLRRFVEVIAIMLLAAMILLIMTQILGRYVFNFSIAWSEELAVFAQIWLVMLGAGITMRRRQHVGIDFLIARRSPLVQRLARSAAMLLVLWFFFVLITGSFSLLAIGMILKSPALQLPMAVPYFSLSFGMCYFLLEFAIATSPDISNSSRAAVVKQGALE